MMVRALSTTLLLASALAAVANPGVVKRSRSTLSLAKRFNPSSKLATITQRDLPGADALINDTGANSDTKNSAIGSRSDNNISPFNKGMIFYTTSICINSCDEKKYTVGIDTASSNTWIGANSSNYLVTDTSMPTNQSVTVHYIFGATFTGDEYTDKVILTPDLVIKRQSFGIAGNVSNVTVFNGIDGILGLGPVSLTIGTLSGTNASVPTVTDNLFSEDVISANLFTIYFEPTTTTQLSSTSSVDWSGEISWGEVDSSKPIGGIHYTNIARTPPVNRYWGIDIQSMYYGLTPILKPTSGIVDTSLSQLFIASDAYEIYMNATGAVVDESTHMLTIDPASLPSLQSLLFEIDGIPFEIAVDAQVYPRRNNHLLENGSPDKIYLNVASLPTDSSSGLGFILGLPFLQRYYSIYDNTNQKLGLAPTKYTSAIINSVV